MTKAVKTGLSISGAVTAASSLDVSGDVAVNTNKFNVTASSGDVAVAGTISIQGHKVYIQSSTPASPAAGDVWIWY